jgi:HAE1 family hydrophobic/amphiphilic exporter-1
MVKGTGAEHHMNFFIQRPIFASVIALLMILAGGISILVLPVAQYPQLVPPQIIVSTQYIGGSAEVVSETTTTPLEEQINGAPGMIYMSSSSTGNGNSDITVTFDIGFDEDIAQVEVLNRAYQAKAQLPEEVNQIGLSIEKKSTSLVLVVALVSPNNSYDQAYLGNYATINVVDGLARIPGVAEVLNFGLQKYAIRVWVDPAKLTNLGLTATDVVDAIRAQNKQLAAGRIGSAPAPEGQAFSYQLNAMGRLEQVSQFQQIILRANPDGTVVRIQDVARVELGGEEYNWAASVNGRPAGVLGIFQEPNANALDIKKSVVAEMEKLKVFFPEDMDYSMPYDTTLFVVASTKEVLTTLYLAIVLVFIVVFVFLQSFRTTLIPAITIPVSLIGAFAVMKLLGFSINTLSLLGLVLAVGLVVDDAIVVVENVMRKLSDGATDVKQVTSEALQEVRSPIIATSLSLIAVFVPVAFMPGMTGQLYNQFALTIAIAVALSAINSLTLSPALCGVLLRPTKNKRQFILFRWFNQGFEWTTERYARLVRLISRLWIVTVLVFLGCCALLYFLFTEVPVAFVPEEDQGYFITVVDMPPASSSQRTQAVCDQVSDLLDSTPGIVGNVMVSGYDIVDGIQDSTEGVLFANLAPWDERKTPELGVVGLMKTMQEKYDQIPGAEVIAVNAPAIPGLASTSGLQLEIQDRQARGTAALAQAAGEFIKQANARPEIALALTTFDAEVPQRYLNIDRTKALSLGVPLNDLFATLQINMGSLYVNEFNKFNRVYRTYVQADKDSRSTAEDIGNLRVRNNAGDMIDLNTLVTVEPMVGPFNITHYNLYHSVLVIINPAPGYSSGQVIDVVEELAKTVLPEGYSTEWTGLVYQQQKAGHMAPIIYALSLLVVFLVLAAQYESWTLPIMVILAVPLGLLGAVVGLLVRDLNLNIYAQIGLVMLIGLTAKNAILIVQFAKEDREAGQPPLEAAINAARVRLRPILMTAFAFILGVFPLAIATGAGANARRAMGTAVVAGMLCSTVLIVFIPMFYYVIERARERVGGRKCTDQAD